MSEQAKIEKKCKLEDCERRFVLTPAAPHKEFCSQDHRIEWHNSRRKAAEKALEEKEAREQQ